MILALIVFARMWLITHRTPPPPRAGSPTAPHAPIPVRPLPAPGEAR
ncbi:MAG TPA: hypothetical protein VMH40_21990 [Myxococcaceae bacterium]|nr:hypothetical protein [Myxococcaceae bacterium]